jgi:ABC-type uncharacterized transport system permease subunit
MLAGAIAAFAKANETGITSLGVIAALSGRDPGVAVPSAVLSALPYIGTAVVLVLISRDARRVTLYRPAMLGRPFRARTYRPAGIDVPPRP